MHIGILALALIFLLSGLKNIQDSGLLSKKKYREQQTEDEAAESRKENFPRRKLYFGILLTFLGLLTLVYYFVYI